MNHSRLVYMLLVYMQPREFDISDIFSGIIGFVGQVFQFIIQIPQIIVAVAIGIFEIVMIIPNFFKATFPFVPGMIFNVIGVLIFLMIGYGIWSFIKGLI